MGAQPAVICNKIHGRLGVAVWCYECTLGRPAAAGHAPSPGHAHLSAGWTGWQVFILIRGSAGSLWGTCGSHGVTLGGEVGVRQWRSPCVAMARGEWPRLERIRAHGKAREGLRRDMGRHTELHFKCCMHFGVGRALQPCWGARPAGRAGPTPEAFGGLLRA